MPTRTAAETVDFPSLARQLGLTRKQREDVLESGAIDPAERRKGRSTQLTPEDAERIRQAARIAAACGGGIAVVVILKLLASGAVKPV